MRDRIDELDKSYGNSSFAFSVTASGPTLSNASKGCVDQNRADLAASFKGCDSFLSAEFPPVRSEAEEWEMELAEIRTDSLKQLEEELAKLGRLPVSVRLSEEGSSRPLGLR
ncbi:unnamed protein product [Calypogeia fissa]